MHKFDKVFLVLVIFISSFFFNGADASRQEKPFLAVFSNPGTYDCWEKYEPNLYYTAKDWSDLPAFLELIKAKIHPGQELILDIDCHGSDTDDLLYIQYEAFGYPFTYGCSVGGLLNKVEESGLKPSKMYLEACYSRLCMEGTLKDFNVKFVMPHRGEVIEYYKYDHLDYPIYGIGTSPSISNVIFLQDKYSIKYSFEDLRASIGKPIDAADHSETTLYALKELWCLLYAYGQ